MKLLNFANLNFKIIDTYLKTYVIYFDDISIYFCCQFKYWIVYPKSYYLVFYHKVVLLKEDYRHRFTNVFKWLK